MSLRIKRILIENFGPILAIPVITSWFTPYLLFPNLTVPQLAVIDAIISLAWVPIVLELSKVIEKRLKVV